MVSVPDSGLNGLGSVSPGQETVLCSWERHFTLKAHLHEKKKNWVRTHQKIGPDLTTFVEKQSNQNGAIGA